VPLNAARFHICLIHARRIHRRCWFLVTRHLPSTLNIAAFVTGSPEERKKKEKACLLFPGLFDALNARRFQVTLAHACAVPMEIDQRIFALARSIQKVGG
jgi:hypothetical protein